MEEEKNDDNNESIELININKEQKNISENKINNNDKKKEDIDRNDNLNKNNENGEQQRIIKNRSPLSLEGAKYPLSIYTRRVMNISKIKKYLNEESTSGRCGGYNLGNTCFMNSSIACISNCTELTYYFLCGDYENDINNENKNGMEGKMAKSWAELLKNYWVENTKIGNPREFKEIIGQKATRFRGFGQQDSNEFMNIFLDYLNEDLNSITNKEYIQLDEKQKDESDEVCSKRFWDSNLKRNDSIITDLFCGQFKSTITCPKCNWICITFEPFYSINLPLKQNKKKPKASFIEKDLDIFIIYYISKYGLRNPYQIKFHKIPNTSKIIECYNLLKNAGNFKFKDLVNRINCMNISFRRYVGEVDEDAILDEYNQVDQKIFFYEVNNEENNDMKIPIYFLYTNEEGNPILSDYPRFIFGKEDMTLEELKKNIYFIIRKYILSPFLKYDEEIDELSERISKYKNDASIKDENIIELLDNEYQRMFSENLSEDDIEFLQNYIEDMPFKLTLRESEGQTVIEIFSDKDIKQFSEKFKKLTQISSLKTYVKDIQNILMDYVIVAEFNIDSKYINKNVKKFNSCLTININYPKVEEEKDKEKENEEETFKPSLVNYLKLFSKEEQLKDGNEWYCKNCKQKVLPTKKIDIYYLPKILMICFKRFIKESSKWEKNDEFVDFPINNFDMKNLIIGPDKEHSIYDLFAVSQHYGTTGFGHYTAVCKNFGKWYNYDDTSVTETNPNSTLTSAAYVLFYKRQTD